MGERGNSKARCGLQMHLERLLVEILLVEAAEDRRQASEGPHQPKLCADEGFDKTETGPARELASGLGLTLHLAEGSAAGEKLREKIVAAEHSIGEIAGLLRGVGNVPCNGPSCREMTRGRFGKVAEGKVDTGSQSLHSRLRSKVEPQLGKAKSRCIVAEVETRTLPTDV